MGRVGEYEMGRTIAAGAYSKVKLVTHCTTKQPYVAKIIPKTNRDVESEIRVEISILRKVHHENVVQLIEILESPRNYYIILEPVLGGDLCSLVVNSQNGIEEGVAADIFSQVLAGLFACHQKGAAHRDLKPENILLTVDGRAKISDFGLSRLHRSSNFNAQSHEYAETLTGTLAYVAPEVLMGQYDAFRADLWSLGCMLYVMLTCRFPFGGAQGEELQERIKRGDVATLPPHVSAEAQDLIQQLLRLNPKERMSLEQAMTHPWIRSSRPSAYATSPLLAAATASAASRSAAAAASASLLDDGTTDAVSCQGGGGTDRPSSLPSPGPMNTKRQSVSYQHRMAVAGGGGGGGCGGDEDPASPFAHHVPFDEESASPVMASERKRLHLPFA